MADADKKIIASSDASGLAGRVLVEPWITEAATAGMELNKYIFRVSPDATKGQIKKAVKDLYKVSVISVNTVSIPRKLRSYGRTPGWKSGFKKAIVTVKAGDKIDLFEGV
jgi:large subunit ribosomal protein L23